MSDSITKGIKRPGCEPVPRDPETMRKAAERQAEAIALLADNTPTQDVMKHLVSKHGCHWRVAYKDIARARKQLTEACAKRGSDEAIGEAIARAEAHYLYCRRMEDSSAGLATLKHLAQLTGALQMADVLIQQQVNALQINGPTGAIAAQLQSMSTDQLGAFVLERVQQLQVTAKAEDN